MNNIEILPFGSSSSGNSIYFRIDDVSFLVDCGFSNKKIRSIMAKYGYEDIDGVFVTHCHSDHIYGVKTIVKKCKGKMYASLKTCNYLEEVSDKEVLNYFEKREVFKGLSVTMLETSHDGLGACGFVFEKDDLKIGYITDTGFLCEESLNYLKGCQICIMESNHDEKMLKEGPYPYYLKRRISGNKGHLSNRQCAEICKILEDFGCKYFFLAHLSSENNEPEAAFKETESVLNNSKLVVLPKFESDLFKDFSLI